MLPIEKSFQYGATNPIITAKLLPIFVIGGDSIPSDCVPSQGLAAVGRIARPERLGMRRPLWRRKAHSSRHGSND
jgi:hypothetical protein